ncbi:hypothetical protein [Polymorphospora sp. NPDC050346]|uniref:hypothetical protein n=1 Tax=Polymorphospora sp. NPDC050346 TaxID=3155780 RepID=UPI0033F862EE
MPADREEQFGRLVDHLVLVEVEDLRQADAEQQDQCVGGADADGQRFVAEAAFQLVDLLVGFEEDRGHARVSGRDGYVSGEVAFGGPVDEAAGRVALGWAGGQPPVEPGLAQIGQPQAIRIDRGE